MVNVVEYRGFTGSIEYSDTDFVWYGKALNIGS